MPAYAFEIRWNGGEKSSWTYLPTDDSARKFAQLLVADFKGGSQYRGSAVIVVKDNGGSPIASFEF